MPWGWLHGDTPSSWSSNDKIKIIRRKIASLPAIQLRDNSHQIIQDVQAWKASNPTSILSRKSAKGSHIPNTEYEPKQSTSAAWGTWVGDGLG